MLRYRLFQFWMKRNLYVMNAIKIRKKNELRK